MVRRPPLSLVIPVRDGLDEIRFVLDAVMAQARHSGTEVLVVGPADGPAPEGVRLVRVDDDNIFLLRKVGVHAARGEIIAIGEDHAVPRPDWCAAVLRAHAEHPEAAAIAGCLVNATADTLSGRGNFLAFAASVQPPMPMLPTRPPPASTLSFKREVLTGFEERLGWLEAELVPRLFADGRIVADDRVVVDHYQDHGVAWSIVNAFHSARSAYGYVGSTQSRRERLRQARWSLANWPRRIIGEARAATRGQPGNRADIAMVAVVGTAAGVGGAVGMLSGPGRSPNRVA